MHRLMSMTNVRRFLSNEEGSTAIEYALIAAGISIAVVGAVNTLGSQVKTTLYDKLAALF